MTAARQSRVNARLPDQVARKLAYLERTTGQSTTEVLRESIERYYAELVAVKRGASGVFAETGFVGCAEGPRELSRSYKNALTASLGKKA